MESDTSPGAGLPVLARATPRVFYGWWVAVGASLISLVCAGIGFYSQGVLLDALCYERGWSRATVSGATSVYFVVTGIAGLAVGRGVDRFGSRAFIAAGAPVLAAALVGVGRVSSQPMLYACALAMALGAALSGAVPTAAIVTRWFARLRARAMTVSQTGVSIGGILLVPLSTWLIRTRGLALATEVLAAIVVGVALPVTALVLRGDPAHHGLPVDGPARAGSDGGGAHVRLPEREFGTRAALATRAFRGLALAFGLGLFAQVGFLAHQLACLRERLAPADAALTVSATALGSVVGRFLVGPLADRMEKRRIAMALFGVQAGATLCFAHASGGAALGAASFVFGLTMGNIFMLQPLLVAEFFGVASFASVLGALQLLTQLASGLGPVALGFAFERFGGYERPLGGLSCIAVAAALVLSRVRAPE